LFSALVAGFLVSLLEAVCTGQVYLPTISFVLKSTTLKFQALAYLLLYNIMFIAPLVVIFALALLGTSSQQFSDFLKKRLGVIKILMAVLFFALGIYLLWRA
jgi:cytochrome c biogenesis protein CcdA